jgi:flagellar hook assembly protein FlgD
VVRTLVSGTLTAGEHVEVWNGRDDSGRSLASGVYFAELQTAEARELTKMTLVK